MRNLPEQLIASLTIKDYDLLLRLSQMQAYPENPIDLHEALSTIRDGFQTVANLMRRGLVQISILHDRAVVSTTLLGKKILAAMAESENTSLLSQLNEKIKALSSD